jgi:hypothetical protein
MNEAREHWIIGRALYEALTIARLKEIYPVARYKNLEGFIEGLRKAGLPE